MRRREFITGLGSAAAWPVVARAQQAMPVIGWLSTVGPGTVLPPFVQALAETGYVVGHNFVNCPPAVGTRGIQSVRHVG
jgi:putative ABC transport system substrate-binding protein